MLAQITANVTAAGPEAQWFETHLDGSRAKPEAAQALLAGFALPVADAGRFAVALCWEEPGRAFLLEVELERVLGKPKRRCDAWQKPGKPAKIAVGEALLGRVARRCRELGIDPLGRVGREERERVAATLDITAGTVGIALTRLRQQQREKQDGLQQEE